MSKNMAQMQIYKFFYMKQNISTGMARNTVGAIFKSILDVVAQ